MLNAFEGKTAVITAGETGIGRPLAAALARRGANIVLASISKEWLDEVAAELSEEAARVLTVRCDVSDLVAVRDLATRAVEEFGAVHILFANAGVTTAGPFLDHSDEDWDWIYAVVLRGVTNCIQAFYPLMARAGEGQIVITGSQAGLLPDWTLGHGPYTSAKAAVMALGAGLRPEAAEHGVGVTVLIVSATDSDLLPPGCTRPSRFSSGSDREILRENIKPREGLPAMAAGSKPFITGEEVAEDVLAKLPANPAFIATHPGMKPLVEEYFARILAAY